MRRLGSGVACGLAGGFVAWALLVPLDVPYHYGSNDIHADVVRKASMEAGVLWLRCALAGALAGGATGLVLRRFPSRVAVATTAVYLFALRGAWGYAGPPTRTGTPLPLIATAIPALLALAAGAALWWRARRDDEPDAGLVALHLCCSFAAAHLALQLPYYLGLAPAFLAGVGDLVRLVVASGRG